MAIDKLNLNALNALTSKIDSGLAPSNSKLISEEYNTLLSAVKAIGAKVNEVIDGGTSDKVVITASGTNGTVTPAASSVDKNTTVTLTATPNAGYEFEKWDDGNTQNPRTVVAVADKAYTAIFKPTIVGDVEITMTDEGKITAMSASNSNEIWYSKNGAAYAKYTSGDITLASNDTFKAKGKNTNSGAEGVEPVVTATYDADANTITCTSTYDMTVGGVNKGKTYTFTASAGTTTIVANERTTTIVITSSSTSDSASA